MVVQRRDGPRRLRDVDDDDDDEDNLTYDKTSQLTVVEALASRYVSKQCRQATTVAGL